MWYLVEQYVWFLLAAFVVGLIVGWITMEKRGLR